MVSILLYTFKSFKSSFFSTLIVTKILTFFVHKKFSEKTDELGANGGYVDKQGKIV